MTGCDIAIIGAGMAGASLAAAIGTRARVALIEAEAHPGYHATGRSAAFWSEIYGGPGVQPLTTASGPFLRDPPADYGAESFLVPRGELWIARAGDSTPLDSLESEFADSEVAMERRAPGALVSGIRPGWSEGLFVPSCTDIDVARLHQAFLKVARRSGTELRCDSPLVAAERRAGSGWQLTLGRGEVLEAAILVNAAGAWADPVAAIAGASPLGIRPYRRTVLQLRVDPPAPDSLPLVQDAHGGFYFKPEPGGRLWLSPHDETPMAPGDVAPDEIDVALAIDRLQQVVEWRIAAVERKWAGLRSFAPDRLPVYGFAPDSPDFFWFAGQGGFGIQTAPAAAWIGAALLLETPLPAMVQNVDVARYAPERFRTRS